jgi:hypothetical protein
MPASIRSRRAVSKIASEGPGGQVWRTYTVQIEEDKIGRDLTEQEKKAREGDRHIQDLKRGLLEAEIDLQTLKKGSGGEALKQAQVRVDVARAWVELALLPEEELQDTQRLLQASPAALERRDRYADDFQKKLQSASGLSKKDTALLRDRLRDGADRLALVPMTRDRQAVALQEVRAKYEEQFQKLRNPVKALEAMGKDMAFELAVVADRQQPASGNPGPVSWAEDRTVRMAIVAQDPEAILRVNIISRHFQLWKGRLAPDDLDPSKIHKMTLLNSDGTSAGEKTFSGADLEVFIRRMEFHDWLAGEYRSTAKRDEARREEAMRGGYKQLVDAVLNDPGEALSSRLENYDKLLLFLNKLFEESGKDDEEP